MAGNKGKVMKTIIDISGKIDPSLGKSISGVSDKLEGVDLKAVAAGAAIAGIAVIAEKAVAETTKYLTKLGDGFNSATNDIAASTGLVGEELDNMSEILKNVYGSNYGESMEDVAAGITAVYKATGLTGDALEETVKDAYALADTFGYDITESSRAAKAMMTNFGISGEEAMGMIAAGAQNGLDYSGELIDSINEYSVQFAKLGFSADEMFSIFQQGADSGAWNLDKVGDAVKEFSIRSIDGSKTTTEAFKALGLNANEMMAIFAAGGDEATYAFQGVLAELMAMDDHVKRDAIGVSLFGTQWEDLGAEAMASLLNMESGIYNAEDAMGKIDSVQFNNLTDAFEALKRQAEVAIMPLAESVLSALLDIGETAGEMLNEFVPMISDAANELAPIVSEVLGLAAGLLKKLLPHILQLARTLLPVLVDVIGTILTELEPTNDIILDLVISLLPLVLSLIRLLLPIVVSVLQVLLPVVGLIAELVSILLPPLVRLIEFLIPIIQAWADAVTVYLGGAISAITPLLHGIMGILGNIIDFIVNIFSGNWADAWQNVVDIFVGSINLIPQALEAVLNFVISYINGVLTGINGLSIFGISIPLIPTVTIPTIPTFATGGITDGLSIAGEDPRYPNEYVISLNPAYRSQNLAYWAEAGRMLNADASAFASGSTVETHGVNIDLGGVTFAPNITVTGHADKDTIMEAIEEEYPEFLDMIEEFLVERGALVYA